MVWEFCTASNSLAKRPAPRLYDGEQRPALYLPPRPHPRRTNGHAFIHRRAKEDPSEIPIASHPTAISNCDEATVAELEKNRQVLYSRYNAPPTVLMTLRPSQPNGAVPYRPESATANATLPVSMPPSRRAVESKSGPPIGLFILRACVELRSLPAKANRFMAHGNPLRSKKSLQDCLLNTGSLARIRAHSSKSYPPTRPEH